MEEVKRCLVVKPRAAIQEVMGCLNANGISYSYDLQDCIIFANISKVPPDLEVIAKVYDPVFGKKDRWFFQIDGDELSNVYPSEHEARVGFKIYVSWSGEFVNNASNP